MDSVAARFRAHVYNRIADAFRLSVKHFILLEDAERESIHQRIAVVTLFENALAAHGGNAEAVAVMRNAGNHALQNSTIARNVERAKTQRVHHRNRASAHGENVAQDAAYASGSALKRLDETWMIVRFDLEGDGVAAADVDDSGVLA